MPSYNECTQLHIYWSQLKDWHIKMEYDKLSFLLVPVSGRLDKNSR